MIVDVRWIDLFIKQILNTYYIWFLGIFFYRLFGKSDEVLLYGNIRVNKNNYV